MCTAPVTRIARSASAKPCLSMPGSSLEMPTNVPSIFPVSNACLLKCDAGRLRLLAEEERHNQDTVPIGNIGMFTINGIWEGELTVVSSHVPFVKEHLFD